MVVVACLAASAAATLPQGQTRDVSTRNGIEVYCDHDDRSRIRRILDGPDGTLWSGREEDVDLEPHELPCQWSDPLQPAFGSPKVDRRVPAIDVAQFAQPSRGGLIERRRPRLPRR